MAWETAMTDQGTGSRSVPQSLGWRLSPTTAELLRMPFSFIADS